jgi:predicted nucleic acid-binding protein
MVVFDTSMLLLVLDPNAKPPADPTTEAPVAQAAARIEYLIDRLSNDREKIIVPTPVLSELLVYAGEAMQAYLQYFHDRAVFRIAPFDEKAAIEAALAHRDALNRGGLRIDAASPDTTRTKIKFDRQIVAITRAEGARAVYSDDEDVIGYATQAGLAAFRTMDLDLPPEDAQQSLDFNPPDAR